LKNVPLIKKFISKFDKECGKYYVNYLKTGCNSMELVKDILNDVYKELEESNTSSESAY